MKIPKILNNGRKADGRVDGEWFQDGILCHLTQSAYGQRSYVREDYMDDAFSRKTTNEAVVGEYDKCGVDMSIHYHINVENYNMRAYALSKTVEGKVIACRGTSEDDMILRFPHYRNLSAFSKIVKSFEEAGALGTDVYVTFRKEGCDKKTVKLTMEGAKELVRAIQSERTKYVSECLGMSQAV